MKNKKELNPLEEAKQFIESLKKMGVPVESLTYCLINMYCEKKISYDDLELLLNSIGASLNENLRNLSDDERIKLFKNNSIDEE